VHLVVEVVHVDDQILDDLLVGQGLDANRLLEVGDLGLTAQSLPPVDEEGVGATDGLPTGVSERQRRIVLVTGVHDRIEDGHPLLEGDVKVVESGFLFPLDFGVVAEHLDEDRLPFEFGLLFGVFVDHPVVFVVESPLLGRLRAFHLRVFRCFLALGFGLLRAHIRSSLLIASAT